MKVREIRMQDLKVDAFIDEQVAAIRQAVGDGLAVNALSGGVDSSVVTLLGHRALADRLKTYFIDNGLMREDEPQLIADIFARMEVKVEIINARKQFFAALKGVEDPEIKRDKGITQVFYKDVFAKLVKSCGAKVLLQGTNYTDVEETVAGIKRQHNILAQLGIDTEKAYGYKVIEPIIELRKPAIRCVAKALGLPEEIYSRPPFPGPALAARVIGEVTEERVALIRAATAIVEAELQDCVAFQYMAILHEDKVTGIRDGKRRFGHQIELRCWDSDDAVTAAPTSLPFELLRKIADRLTTELPGVVSVTYNIAAKPPSCIEAV
ncbi:MAG: ExsB family transcriptional regulator [Planctomycetes bacterium]|nr:ExsB family transcriptional regulator [Planctomycetota bacterium]